MTHPPTETTEKADDENTKTQEATQDDAELAAKWFRKSAEEGDAEAQNSLGELYKEGRGVPQDDAEAVAWFRKSAEQGLAKAREKLASRKYSKTVDGVVWDYEVKNGNSAIVGIEKKTKGDVAIPSVLGGHPVTSIGEKAFKNCKGLTSVTIPDTVTSIGDSAFYDCKKLTSVTIPDSVTEIGDRAFEGCSSLKSVMIGNGVKSIGHGASMAFKACSGLESFIVAAGCGSFESEDGVLYSKGGETLVAYPSGREGAFDVPDTVTKIGGGAFGGCKGLMSVTIPDSVTEIGDLAFAECSGLRSVTIPNSVTRMETLPFRNCTKLDQETRKMLRALCPGRDLVHSR